jgi:Uma2 family endonuclease
MSELMQRNTGATGLKLSYKDFLTQYDGTHAEWVNGEVELIMSASLRHQDVVSFLGKLIETYAQLNNLGKLIQAPFNMKLPAKPSGHEPDLLFVSTSNLPHLKTNFLDGAADLIIEVVSPESRTRDTQTKFQEYQTAKIPEYWLINPEDQTATFYRLNSNGIYQAQTLDAEGKYHANILTGFWLKPAWLWQNPLPDVEDCMLDIDGEKYRDYLLNLLQKRGLLPS